jgi:neutral ceramidase
MACRRGNIGGMQGMMLSLIVSALAWMSLAPPALPAAEAPLRAGVATADITPAGPYPMSGYYFERLSTGTKDPLHAKALVLRQGDTAAAIICCDLIVIASDLTDVVREAVERETGIPGANVCLAATHTHTGPDYTKELFQFVTGRKSTGAAAERVPYVPRLIDGLVAAVKQADRAATEVTVTAGNVLQETPVSFNRRFLMKDGSVRTWAKIDTPGAIRPAGPIDEEIGVVRFDDAGGKPRGLLSSFALHLDTVGGTEYSADFPFFIEREIRDALGGSVVSLFGNGCCGNINHVDPTKSEANKTDFIGSSIGRSIVAGLPALVPVEAPRLQVRTAKVDVPILDATPEQVAAAKKLLGEIKAGAKPDFLAHVDAYRRLIIDNLRHDIDQEEALEWLGWGLSKKLAGSGNTMPLGVQVITLGRDVAVVAFPGESFVEHGLAIKNASPFRTTLVVELANHGETIYVPTRAAAVGGGYETTNTTVAPGAGELMVEACVRLLHEAAAAIP